MNDVLRVSGPGLRVARGPHMTYDTRWPPQAWGPNPVSTLRGNPFGAHPGYGYADGAGTGMHPSAYSATLTVGTDGTNPSYPGYGTTVSGYAGGCVPFVPAENDIGSQALYPVSTSPGWGHFTSSQCYGANDGAKDHHEESRVFNASPDRQITLPYRTPVMMQYPGRSVSAPP